MHPSPRPQRRAAVLRYCQDQGARRHYKQLPQKLPRRRTRHKVPQVHRRHVLKRALHVPTRVYPALFSITLGGGSIFSDTTGQYIAIPVLIPQSDTPCRSPVTPILNAAPSRSSDVRLPDAKHFCRLSASSCALMVPQNLLRDHRPGVADCVHETLRDCWTQSTTSPDAWGTRL